MPFSRDNLPRFLYWVVDLQSLPVRFPSELLKDSEIQKYCDLLNEEYPCPREIGSFIFNDCEHHEHYAGGFSKAEQYAHELHIESIIRVKTSWIKPKPERLPEAFADFVGYKYLYECTLTVPQEQVDPKNLLEGFEKLVKSKMYACLGYIACVELTQAGSPHMHILFFSRTTLDGTKVKKLYQYRYQFSRVRRPENYYNYIYKERGNPLVEYYCAQYGIQQFYKSVN